MVFIISRSCMHPCMPFLLFLLTHLDNNILYVVNAICFKHPSINCYLLMFPKSADLLADKPSTCLIHIYVLIIHNILSQTIIKCSTYCQFTCSSIAVLSSKKCREAPEYTTAVKKKERKASRSHDNLFFTKVGDGRL